MVNYEIKSEKYYILDDLDGTKKYIFEIITYANTSAVKFTVCYRNPIVSSSGVQIMNMSNFFSMSTARQKWNELAGSCIRIR